MKRKSHLWEADLLSTTKQSFQVNHPQYTFDDSDSWALVYLQTYQDTILNTWIALLQDTLSPTYADIPWRELKCLCQAGLEIISSALNPYHSNSQSEDLVAWALMQHYTYQASLADVVSLLSTLRTTLLNRLDAGSFIKQLDLENNLPRQTFIIIDKVLNQGLTDIISAFSELTEQKLHKRLQEMEQLTLVSATITEEADRALVQLQALYDTAQRLSTSLDVPQIIKTLVSQLTIETYAHSTALWKLKDNLLQLETCYDAAFDEGEMLLIPLRTEACCSFMTAIHHHTTVIIKRDMETHLAPLDLWVLDSFKANIILVLPLIVQKDLIGVITLHSSLPELVNDIDLIKTIVQQGAIAIENGRLYDKVQHLNQTLETRIAARTMELVQEKERLEAMYQISTFLTKTLDVDCLMTEVLSHMATVVQAQDGTILLTTPSNEELVYGAKLKPIKTQLLTNLDELFGEIVLADHQLILVDDLHHDVRWTVNADSMRSVIALPLLVGDDLQGVLIFTHHEPYKFTFDHSRLLETVASQIATAIHNAQLHNQVTEQTLHLSQMLHAQKVETTQKQTILTAIADGVVASDLNGDIILVNPVATEILGKTDVDLLGEPITVIFEIFDLADQAKILAYMSVLKEQGSLSQTDLLGMEEIILELKSRIISARVTLAIAEAEYEEVTGIVVVLRDITKEVQAAKAKSEFVSMVSHELRIPMTSIKGYVKMLQQEVGGTVTAEQQGFLDVIERNVSRLALLINDLLDISRIEAGKITLKLAPVDLNQAIQEVVDTLHISAEEKGLQLTFESVPDLEQVWADKDRVVQILTNLIGNSIAYTVAGRVEIQFKSRPDNIQIDIIDTGVGISSEAMSHIFERFYRADDKVVQARGGTGLGLPIVKTLIEMHGGRIWVNSEVGQGSTFSFNLPTYHNI